MLLVAQSAGVMALAALAALVAGAAPAIVALLYVAAVTPALCLHDIREHRLPNVLVLPGYAAVGAAAALTLLLGAVPPLSALLGGLGYLAFTLVLHLAGGMGFGDVKLAGVLGATAGFLGGAAVVLAVLLSFLAGGLFSAVLLWRRKRRRRIPFGPFMLAGFWLAVPLATVFV